MEARTRVRFTTGENNRMRAAGWVPGILYGGGEEPVHISVPEASMTRGNRHFYTTPVELEMDGGAVKALPKEVQLHPVTGAFLHVDFIRLLPGSKVKVKVPVELLNASTSKGAKLGGVVTLLQRQVLTSCPGDKIPSSIEVDVKNLNLGESVRMSQLSLPNGCVALGVPHQPVASVTGSAKQDTREAASEEQVDQEQTEESE